MTGLWHHSAKAGAGGVGDGFLIPAVESLLNIMLRTDSPSALLQTVPIYVWLVLLLKSADTFV